MTYNAREASGRDSSASRSYGTRNNSRRTSTDTDDEDTARDALGVVAFDGVEANKEEEDDEEEAVTANVGLC